MSGLTCGPDDRGGEDGAIKLGMRRCVACSVGWFVRGVCEGGRWLSKWREVGELSFVVYMEGRSG